MKKSEIYKKAMIAVIRDAEIGTEETLEILKVLMSDMTSEEWRESREENKA